MILHSALFILLLSLCTSIQANNHPTEEDWSHTFGDIQSPKFISDNRNAFIQRLLMLDTAPSGSTASILTFSYQNDIISKTLAAHICRASMRGVIVRFLIDSRYGSIPGENNVFNYEQNEELYQYMANCGADIRIHDAFSDFFSVFGLAVPHYKYFFKKKLPLSALNRLSHRKLFQIETPGGQSCFFLGGRNIETLSLDWNDNTSIDGDIFICNHFKRHPQELPLGDTGNFDVLFKQVEDSFFSIWNDDRNGANGDNEEGVTPVVQRILPRHDFPFQYLYYKDSHFPDWLPGWSKYLADEPDKTDRPLGEMPPIRRYGKVHTPRKHNLRLSYDWQLKTAIWNQERDEIRQAIHDGIEREQSEIYIETGYLFFDKKTQQLLADALERGVHITIISNSIFSTVNKAAKLENLFRISFNHEFLDKYGRDSYSQDYTPYHRRPRHLIQYPHALGRYTMYSTTPHAGHTVHFKGIGFKCQKTDDGRYHKSFIVGSHNFNVRSGLSDKEHALMWKEPVDMSCINRIGEQEAWSAGIDIDEVRSLYQNGRLIPRYYDLIEYRLRFWSLLNQSFKKDNKPLLLAYPSFLAELESAAELPEYPVFSISLKVIKPLARLLLYRDYHPEKIPTMKSTAKRFLDYLSKGDHPLIDFL